MSRSTRVYVGDLPGDIRASELIDEFARYAPRGHPPTVEIKQAGRGAYAFIQFDDYRDADDAVYDMDNRRVFGGRIRVELSKERPPRRDHDEKKYRVLLTGLPSCTWQELKDLGRPHGDVTFADVKGSYGVLEYLSESAQSAAISQLNKYDMNGTIIDAMVDPSGPGSYKDLTANIQSDRPRRNDRDGGRGRGGPRDGGRGRGRGGDRERDRGRDRDRDGGRDRSRSRSPDRNNHYDRRSPSPSRRDGNASPQYREQEI